jgi:hypothetical protein
MTSGSLPLGIQTDDRYRTIPEARMIEALMLCAWTFDLESPLAAEATREALLTWTRLGLGFRRAANGERLFDPIEVTNFLKLACLEGRDNFWEERYVSNFRRLISEVEKVDSADSSSGGEKQFVVEFRRTFHLGAIAPDSQLRLRAPLPLEGHHLRNLQVMPLIETSREARVNAGRLQVRVNTSGEAATTIGARLSFTARQQETGFGLDESEPDKELYLRWREGLIVVSERVAALAHSLTAEGAPPLEALRSFWTYMLTELNCGLLHYDQVDTASPCDWVLNSGWYDCQTGAALFAALCRARGIPARIVGGYALYHRLPANHYWAEVWVENRGWLSFDFFGWELSRGGRDMEWADRFFGRLDYRMITERLPLEFVGAIGVPIPPAWFLLPVAKAGGIEIDFLNINGTSVYTDLIRITG